MPLSGHDEVAVLNDVANDVESTPKKIEINVIIASLKNEIMGTLINRISGPSF